MFYSSLNFPRAPSPVPCTQVLIASVQYLNEGFLVIWLQIKNIHICI